MTNKKRLDGKKVAYIEDDKNIADITRRVLACGGLDVAHFWDLKSFYDWQDRNEPADFYISDGTFPVDNSGFDGPSWEGVAKKVTELSRSYPDRIKGMVVVSGGCSGMERIHERNYPVLKTPYLIMKPFNVGDLCTIVSHYLTSE